MSEFVDERVHSNDWGVTRFYPDGKIPYKVLKVKDVPANDPINHEYPECSYCGSLHPKAALALLEQGVPASGSDWKYGWPHKFYIQAAGNGRGKFYSKHLYDADIETFARLTEILDKKLGILFAIDDKDLKYSAPYNGFQTWINHGGTLDDEAPKVPERKMNA